MKYYVTYEIRAYYVAEVEADNLEEAKRKASEDFFDADFGMGENIDGEQIIIEDENENIIWER